MNLAETFRSLWLIIIFGTLLLLVGTHILIWNEGRAVEILMALDETMQKAKTIGLSNGVNTDYKQFDFSANENENASANEELIVHITGPILIGEPLTEPDYNIQVLAVKLKRRVQMYQWVEEYIQYDYAINTDVMKHDDEERTYYYRCDWRDYIVDSNSFRFPNGHQNPKTFPLESATQVAEAAYIGQYELGTEVKARFYNFRELTSDSRPDDTNIKLHTGFYHHTEDIFRPEVGDIRIHFTAAGFENEIYSVVGKLTENNLIVPYVTSKNKSVLLVKSGHYNISEIFLQEHRNQRWITWSVRFIGWIFIFFGITCNSKIFHILLNRVSILSFMAPDLQYPIGGNLMLAVTLALLIASFAWIFYRPVIGIGLIFGAFSPFIWLVQNIVFRH